MSRPAIRTRTLSLDMIERVTGLFGTIMNAHRQLGLDGLVPYTAFYRGMHFQTVTPQHFMAIDNAWKRWQEVFLRPEVPVSDPLVLTVEYRDAEPDWWLQPSKKTMSKRKSA